MNICFYFSYVYAGVKLLGHVIFFLTGRTFFFFLLPPNDPFCHDHGGSKMGNLDMEGIGSRDEIGSEQ